MPNSLVIRLSGSLLNHLTDNEDKKRFIDNNNWQQSIQIVDQQVKGMSGAELQIVLQEQQEACQPNHEDLQITIHFTRTQFSSATAHVSPYLDADNSNTEQLKILK